MNPDAPTPREQLEARLTALLLGELPAAEAAALREQITQDADLQAMHRRLEHTIELVRETAADPVEQTAEQPAPLRLSEERREKLLAQFKTVTPREFVRPAKRDISWLVPMAAAVVLIGMIAPLFLPALARSKAKAQRHSLVTVDELEAPVMKPQETDVAGAVTPTPPVRNNIVLPSTTEAAAADNGGDKFSLPYDRASQQPPGSAFVSANGWVNGGTAVAAYDRGGISGGATVNHADINITSNGFLTTASLDLISGQNAATPGLALGPKNITAYDNHGTHVTGTILGSTNGLLVLNGALTNPDSVNFVNSGLLDAGPDGLTVLDGYDSLSGQPNRDAATPWPIKDELHGFYDDNVKVADAKSLNMAGGNGDAVSLGWNFGEPAQPGGAVNNSTYVANNVGNNGVAYNASDIVGAKWDGPYRGGAGGGGRAGGRGEGNSQPGNPSTSGAASGTLQTRLAGIAGSATNSAYVANAGVNYNLNGTAGTLFEGAYRVDSPGSNQAGGQPSDVSERYMRRQAEVSANKPLETRTFRVDDETFRNGLDKVIGGVVGGGGGAVGGSGRFGGGGGVGGNGGGLQYVTVPSSTAAVQSEARLYFSTAGVDLSTNDGKTVIYNDRKGTLTVRATPQDLDLIEAALPTLNTAPPEVNVKAKFAEITQNDSRAIGFSSVDGGSRIIGVATNYQLAVGNDFKDVHVDYAVSSDASEVFPARTANPTFINGNPNGGATFTNYVAGANSTIVNGSSVVNVGNNFGLAAQGTTGSTIAAPKLTPPPMLGDTPLAEQLFRSSKEKPPVALSPKQAAAETPKSRFQFGKGLALPIQDNEPGTRSYKVPVKTAMASDIGGALEVVSAADNAGTVTAPTRDTVRREASIIRSTDVPGLLVVTNGQVQVAQNGRAHAIFMANADPQDLQDIVHDLFPDGGSTNRTTTMQNNPLLQRAQTVQQNQAVMTNSWITRTTGSAAVAGAPTPPFSSRDYPGGTMMGPVTTSIDPETGKVVTITDDKTYASLTDGIINQEWKVVQNTQPAAPRPNVFNRTNLIYTGKGRETILSKLDRIRVDNANYQDVPLSLVLDALTKIAKNRDPDGKGINFFVNRDAAQGAYPPPVIDPATGLPVPFDASKVTVRVNLNDVRLADVLDAVKKSAALPINYSVSDYAVEFSLDTNAPAQVVTIPDRPEPRVAAPPLIPQPEVLVRENAFSTFSLNVSDVSFKLTGASLEKGLMPDPGNVRSEEFINAFDYRDPEPPPGARIGFTSERARYPFAHNRDLLRFAIKTAAAGRQPGRAMNIVLLLDNSGSMERADRVAIIHEALRVLASQLQPQDKLSVVTFARTARLWVDGISGGDAADALEKASELTPEGGTNLEEAMRLAYETALRHYLAGGVNRVVLLTDGAANLGNVDPEMLRREVELHRQQGVALDCFGIGWEGYNDDLLEVLSRHGDGRYGFINTPEEAATGFAGQLAGAFNVAAGDVKVQVEFNPKRTTAYRQIGYAKHQLTKEQFRDNTVDAAEIAAAESGNALYTVDVNPQGEGPVCTVRVRYKIPGTQDFREQAWDVPYDGAAPALESASPAMRLAATASAFSEWLGASPFASEVEPDRLLAYLNGVPEVYGADARPKKLEAMIRQAKAISGR